MEIHLDRLREGCGVSDWVEWFGVIQREPVEDSLSALPF